MHCARASRRRPPISAPSCASAANCKAVELAAARKLWKREPKQYRRAAQSRRRLPAGRTRRRCAGAAGSARRRRPADRARHGIGICKNRWRCFSSAASPRPKPCSRRYRGTRPVAGRRGDAAVALAAGAGGARRESTCRVRGLTAARDDGSRARRRWVPTPCSSTGSWDITISPSSTRASRCGARAFAHWLVGPSRCSSPKPAVFARRSSRFRRCQYRRVRQGPLRARG